MAQQETTTLLRIDTREAVKSIQDLKDNIAIYKDMLNKAEVGSEQYRLVAQHLAENQNALKDAMYGGITSLGQLASTAKGTTESYNGLVHKMADLKKNLRNVDTSTEAGRKEFLSYADQIKGVNDKLKHLDELQGNYQRNVGNYANSIASISGLFGNAGKAATGAIAGVKGLTAGLKAMAATPAIAILTALSALLQKVTSALKSSEANMEKMTIAFAPFQAGGDAVTKVIQKMGEGLGKLAEGFARVLDKMGLYNEKMKERKALAEEEISILHAQRDANRETAEDELKIAQLKAQASDKVNLSAEERLAKLKEASDLEEAISKRNYELAEREWKLIKAKNALTDSSTEELNKENEAYIKMTKAQTAYYMKQRELNAQITEATTQMSTQRINALKKEQEEAALIRQNLLNTYEQGSLEYLQVSRDNALQAVNEVISNGKQMVQENGKLVLESQAAYDARYLAANKAFWTADKALQEAKLKESTAGLRLAMEERKNDREAQLAGELALAQNYYDNLKKLEGESEAEFAIRRQQADNDQKAKAQALDDYLLAQEKLGYENRLALMDSRSLEYAVARVDFKKWEVDQILLEGKRETETEEEYNARRIAAEQEYTDEKRNLLEKQIAMGQEYAGVFADMFGAIADLIEESDGENEKAFKATKALRIAEATINTISGAVGAFMQATATYAPPVGQIIGAAQAAAVTAAGATNIAKIRKTTLDSSSDSSVSTGSSGTQSVSTPSISEVVNTTNEGDTTTINNSSVSSPVTNNTDNRSTTNNYDNRSEIDNRRSTTNNNTSVTNILNPAPKVEYVIPVSVSAPAVTPSIQVVRTAQTARDKEEQKVQEKEQQKSQKVYILASDIEASQNDTKVRVSEASF